MTRGVVLSVRERPFVEAAEMVGCAPDARRAARTSCPTCSRRSPRLAVLEFARIILAEAALSFLGLGIQYPGVTWGLDIARAGDHELFGNQWLIIYPGLLLSLTVLAVNLLSSWLRVMLDPQEREKRFASQRPGNGQVPSCERRRRVLRRPRRSAAGAAVDTLEPPLLEVEQLRVDFFTRRGVVQAVRNVSFRLDRGETLGIVGESGLGQERHGADAARSDRAARQDHRRRRALEGRVVGDTTPTPRLSRVRGKEIAMVFQDPMTSLNPLFTVGTQITEVLPATHRGVEAAGPRPRRRAARPGRHRQSRANASSSTHTRCRAACASAC